MDLKKYVKEQKEKPTELASKQYAIGKYIITQEQLENIRECFSKGMLPPDFEFYQPTLNNGMQALGELPYKKFADCNIIQYKDTLFAKYAGFWEIVQNTKIDNIPSITEKELPFIGERATLSSDGFINLGFKNIDDKSRLQEALDAIKNEFCFEDLKQHLAEQDLFKREIENIIINTKYELIASIIHNNLDEISQNDKIADKIMDIISEEWDENPRVSHSFFDNIQIMPSNLANKILDFFAERNNLHIVSPELFYYVDGKQLEIALKYIEDGIKKDLDNIENVNKSSFGLPYCQRLALASNVNIDTEQRDKLFKDSVSIVPSILFTIKNTTDYMQEQLSNRIIDFLTGDRRKPDYLHADMYDTELNFIKRSCPQLFTVEGIKTVLEKANEDVMMKIIKEGNFRYSALQDSHIKIAIADAIEKTEYYKKVSDPLYEPSKEEEWMANCAKDEVTQLRKESEEKDKAVKEYNIDENSL